jgi:hypothetical protein
MEDVCESWFWFRHCFLYSKAHLRYMCFLVDSSVQHILCCVFGLFFVVLCKLCCQFLWIVHFRLPLWYSLTFIDKMVCGINEEWSICKHLLRFSLHCNLNKTLCMLESWCYLWFGYMWLYLYRYFGLRRVAPNTYCVVFLLWFGYIEQHESHWKRGSNLRCSGWVSSPCSTYGTRLVIPYAVLGLLCNFLL